MRRILFAMIIFIACLAPSQASAKIVDSYPPLPKGIKPVDLGGGVELLYYRIVREKYEGYRVIGEIRNTTDDYVASPGLAFTLTSKDGNIDGVISAFPVLYQIPPQSRMPFAGTAEDENAVHGAMAKDEVSVTACLSDSTIFNDAELKLSIFDIRETTKDLKYDRYKITGKVRNESDTPAEDVNVVALLFDQHGRFAGDITPVRFPNVPAGKSASFVIDDGYNVFMTASPLGLVGSTVTTVLKVGHVANVYMECQA